MTFLLILGIVAALGIAWFGGYVLYIKYRLRHASEAEVLDSFANSEKEEAQPR
jgi:hypothetical protein